MEAHPLSLREVQGYQYVLRTLSPGRRADGEAIPSSSFADAMKRQEPIALEIYRDDVLMRRKRWQTAELATGPLQLAAQRIGDHLSFTVNNLSIECFDPVTHDSRPRAFGIEWPEQGSLRELVALRQTLPEKPSPFQRGDELYAEGHYAEALTEYQQQIQAAGGAEAEQQVRYQEALCLLALNRQAEAEAQFERLAAEAGERWPALASCRLWLIRVQQNRFEDSDAIFEHVSARYSLEDLAAFVPSELAGPDLPGILQPDREAECLQAQSQPGADVQARPCHRRIVRLSYREPAVIYNVVFFAPIRPPDRMARRSRSSCKR